MRTSLFLTCALSCLAACVVDGASAPQCSGGKCDDAFQDETSRRSDHRNFVISCIESMNARMDPDGDTAKLVTAIHGGATCITVANDRAAAFIDAVTDSEAGATRSAFDAYRDVRICGDLVAASDGAHGSNGSMYAANCELGRELALADVIDAYVVFARGEQIILGDHRFSAPACYDTFDLAIEAAGGNQPAMNQAAIDLADCIGDLARSRAPLLRALILENDPTRDPSEVLASVTARLEQTLSTNIDACSAISAAGAGGGGSIAAMDSAMCRAEFAGKLLHRIDKLTPRTDAE